MEQHYLHSSFREKLIEHLLVGELLKHSWCLGDCSLEVSKPEVDRAGYDLILEHGSVIRHAQLKASHSASTTAKQKIQLTLADKPSGCVVWTKFDEKSLELGPFLFFGGSPGRPMPDLNQYQIAKHTKGNAEGYKAERIAHRVIPRSHFSSLETIAALWAALFVIE